MFFHYSGPIFFQLQVTANSVGGFALLVNQKSRNPHAQGCLLGTDYLAYFPIEMLF